MAQQVFPQWSPVVRAHNEDQQEVYIPAAIIHAQTRDGKDELIVGAATMQKDDVTGLYLPTNKDFPLETRVRHLEALIGKLDASKETDPDAASATLLALLRGLLAAITAIKDNEGIKKIADAVTVDGLNALATESTLGEVKSALAALGATSDAAETDPDETASQIALLKGLLTRLNTVAGTVDNGAAKVTLTGRKVSRVQPAPLTTTPLGANATYTQPWQDAEAWQGAGGTGALVVSGVAKADKPGTLFLDVSYDGTDSIVWDTALANSTGVARLRPTTIPLRYFRFRYRNGGEAQNSFVLVQNVMQEGDGKGAEHGMGADRFSRTGPMAAGTVELIADLRSAVQIMSIQLVSRTPQAAIRISGYKDDGSVAPVNYATFSSAAMLDHRISSVYSFGHSWFEVTRWEDQDAQYIMWTRPGAPLLFPRGVQIYVANNDSAEYNVHCHVYVRLL